MIETLLLPFQFPFMQNGFLISLIVSPAAALLSCFLVLKGWALMGDAVSHAILPGVVLAYLLGIPLIVGAFAAGMGCSLLTGYLAENSRVKRDTVMGVVFSGMFAVGLILFVAFPSDAHLDQILFGNMLGVGPADLWTGLAISGPVVAVLSLKWRDFLLHAFDPAQAQAAGLNTRLLHYGLLTILSLVVVAVLDLRRPDFGCRSAGDAGGHSVSGHTKFRTYADRCCRRLHRFDADGHICEFLAGQCTGTNHRAGFDGVVFGGLHGSPYSGCTTIACRP